MLVVLHLPEKIKIKVTFKLFFLAVATLAFVAGYATARSQSFRKLGLYHQHVNYATVGVQLDMGPFQDYVFLLSKALSDVKFQRMNSFGRGTCSRLINTMHAVERCLGDCVLFLLCTPQCLCKE